MDDNRKCSKCGVNKPAAAFGAHGNQCKACKVKAARRWALANPERARENGRVGNRRRRAAQSPGERKAEYDKANATRRSLNPRMGETFDASCSRCSESFSYVFVRKHRTVCDSCRAHDNDWRTFRLTGVEAAALRARGACDICKGTVAGGRFGNWHIDHDHVTGKVCGVLCAPCNTALGLMGDRPERLRAAALYLETHGRTGR